ncbi:Sodium/sulfate symporter [Phycomyces nitens]|nr:Sodium/sulfate symporter [Phycomyces nitens]
MCVYLASLFSPSSTHTMARMTSPEEQESQSIDTFVPEIYPNETTSLLSTKTRLSTGEPWFLVLYHSKPVSLVPSILLGSAIWFGITPTEELTLTAIRLLAVFTSCIFALISTNIDISLIVLSALITLSLTQSFQCTDHATGLSVECRLCGDPNSLGGIYQCKGSKDSFEQALTGFSSSVVWLIFAAFHLGKAVEVTQLGQRVSLMMVKTFGQHIIGLGYAIVLSELLLAPFVPSNTARGGGIVLPVVNSIAKTLGASPTQDAKLGGFLTLVGSHANLISASMYLTGMAPNPIVLAKASQLYPDMQFNFMTWLAGSCVPALFCAISLPPLIWWLCGLNKPDKSFESTHSPRNGVVRHAQEELARMGPMSSKEWCLCWVLILCLCLWVTGGYTNIDSTLVALIGIAVLLHTSTISWKDVSTNTNAWDSLFWLGGFITIAQQLSEAGASAFMGHKISLAIIHFNLPPVLALSSAYFLTTFMFSSLSAHTVAFVGTFLDAGHALGASPMVLTALMAYFGALGGCMTNFSTGMATMYYTLGYVSRPRWFIIGFTLAGFYMLVYFTLGFGWWKLLGWY